MQQHNCDTCGATRNPDQGMCSVCGIDYRPWAYLTHHAALNLVITLDQAVDNGSTHIITHYSNNRATIGIYDDARGHIGDL